MGKVEQEPKISSAEPLNPLPNRAVDIYADFKLVGLKLEVEDLTGSSFNHFLAKLTNGALYIQRAHFSSKFEVDESFSSKLSSKSSYWTKDGWVFKVMLYAFHKRKSC